MKKKKAWILALLILVFTVSTQCATYYVATDGVDAAGRGNESVPFQTITYAVNIGLAPGDIVAVKSGTYNEQVTIPDGLSGTADDPIVLMTIDGPKTATIFWQNPNNRAWETWPTGPAVVQLNNSAHIIIDGFIVSGGVDREHGVTSTAARFTNSSFCTFQNGVLKNSYNGWNPSPNGDGTVIGNKCLNTEIYDNGYAPMIQISPDVCMAGYGAYIGQVDKGERNIMDGCDLHDNCAYGVQVKGYDNIIRNCKIHGNGRGAVDPDGNPFYANGARSPAGGGITLNAGSGGQFYNNLIYNNANWGIAAVGYGEAAIYNNTIFDNNLVGTSGNAIVSTYSNSSTGHVVRNNILLQNSGGEIRAGYEGSTDAYLVEDHNFVDDGSYLDLTNGPTHEGTIETATLPFLSIDPASPDFLKPDPNSVPSPIDAGADLPDVITDINGVSRPTSGYDMGAYEYAPDAKVSPGSFSRQINLSVFHHKHDGVDFLLYLSRSGHFTLRIVNASGREVWSYEKSRAPSGTFLIYWDGRDEDLNPVANGTYFASLSTEDVMKHTRIVITN
jgi:hypothetical protein